MLSSSSHSDLTVFLFYHISVDSLLSKWSSVKEKKRKKERVTGLGQNLHLRSLVPIALSSVCYEFQKETL